MNTSLRVVSANVAPLGNAREQYSLHLTCAERLVTLGDVVDVVQTYLEQHRQELGLHQAATVRVSLVRKPAPGRRPVWEMDLRSVQARNALAVD